LIEIYTIKRKTATSSKLKQWYDVPTEEIQDERKHANGSDGITIKIKEAYLATEKCTSPL
jgi:hypothetical protein